MKTAIKFCELGLCKWLWGFGVFVGMFVMLPLITRHYSLWKQEPKFDSWNIWKTTWSTFILEYYKKIPGCKDATLGIQSPNLRMVSWNQNTMLKRWLETPIILWQYDWMPGVIYVFKNRVLPNISFPTNGTEAASPCLEEQMPPESGWLSGRLSVTELWPQALGSWETIYFSPETEQPAKTMEPKEERFAKMVKHWVVPPPSNSHYQDNITFFRFGDPNLNLHLPRLHPGRRNNPS